MTITQIQQPLSLTKCVIDGVVFLTRLAPVFALAFGQKLFEGFTVKRGALFQKLRHQRMNNGLFNAQSGFAFVQIIRRAETVLVFWSQRILHLLCAIIIGFFVATVGAPGDHKGQRGGSA